MFWLEQLGLNKTLGSAGHRVLLNIRGPSSQISKKATQVAATSEEVSTCIKKVKDQTIQGPCLGKHLSMFSQNTRVFLEHVSQADFESAQPCFNTNYRVYRDTILIPLVAYAKVL